MWKPNAQLKKCLDFVLLLPYTFVVFFCCHLLGSFPNIDSKCSTHTLFQVFVTWQTTSTTFPQHSPTWLCLAIHLNIFFLHLKISEYVLPPFWHTSWLVFSLICSVINILHNKIFFIINLHSWHQRIQENSCHDNFVIHWIIYFCKHRLRVKIQNYVPLSEPSFLLWSLKNPTKTKPKQNTVKGTNVIPRLTGIDTSVSPIFKVDAWI